MDNVWVYAGAGFAGLLWGMGTVSGTVAVAFVAGVWMGAGGDVAKWATIALIIGYIVGNLLLSKKGQAAK